MNCEINLITFRFFPKIKNMYNCKRKLGNLFYKRGKWIAILRHPARSSNENSRNFHPLNIYSILFVYLISLKGSLPLHKLDFFFLKNKIDCVLKRKLLFILLMSYAFCESNTLCSIDTDIERSIKIKMAVVLATQHSTI